MRANITQYVNNQFEPKSLESGRLSLSANQTSNLTAGNHVEFDQMHGNLTFDSSTHRVTLKANKTYKLNAETLAGCSTGYISVRWYDVTNAQYLTASNATVDYPYNSSASDTGSELANAEVTPSTDIEVELRIVGQSSLTNIQTNSWASIVQVDKQKRPNTYPFEVNAQQYDLSVSGTNWTTVWAKGEPYKLLDGTWKLKINIYGTLSVATSAVTITIAGVKFKNFTGSTDYQAVCGYAISGANVTNYFLANDASDGAIDLNVDASRDSFSLVADLILEEKPTWL